MDRLAALPLLFSDPLIAPILLTATTAAFLHAALPTHWLPFVLVGRGQGWGLKKTLHAATLAGLAHVGVTVLVGLVVVGVGLTLEHAFEGVLKFASSALLAVLGVYYLASGPHRHGAGVEGRRFASDGAALAGLIGALALYPSEAYLPIYLSAASFGWTLFLVLSVVLLVATLVGMAVFVSLAAAGARRLKLERFERFERAILGLALLGLSVALLVWHP